jgi:hypothetical protein
MNTPYARVHLILFGITFTYGAIPSHNAWHYQMIRLHRTGKILLLKQSITGMRAISSGHTAAGLNDLAPRRAATPPRTDKGQAKGSHEPVDAAPFIKTEASSG